MNPTRRILMAAAAVLAIGVASCSQVEGRKPTFPVTGNVLLPDGRPAAHATVVFHPAADDPDPVRPRGKVAADGTFRLTTYDGDDGAPAGDYRVTVELYLASPRPDEGPSNRLNPKYARAESSGLTATVGTGPTELKTISLKK